MINLILRVLVTGGGGFIGSNLVEKLLKKNFSVTALVQYSVDNNFGWLDKIDFKKNKPKVITGDICDSIFVDKICKNIDYVIHLAALISIPYSYRSPLSYIHTNILGTTNLLESCRKNKISIFFTLRPVRCMALLNMCLSMESSIECQSPYKPQKLHLSNLFVIP